MKRIGLCFALAVSLLLGCAGPRARTSEPKGSLGEGGPAPGKFIASLPAEEQEEFDLAQRGLIARDPGLDIRTQGGNPVWDMKMKRQ